MQLPNARDRDSNMNKKAITIILHRSELVRCIKEMAYVIAKGSTMRSEDGVSPDHKIADILDMEDGGTDGNHYLGMRSINSAVSTLRALTRKHADRGVVHAIACNGMQAPEEYILHLHMETDTPEVLADVLQEKATKYVALTAIAEWSRLLGSELSALYQQEAEVVKQEILGLLNPPTRTERTLYPIW